MGPRADALALAAMLIGLLGVGVFLVRFSAQEAVDERLQRPRAWSRGIGWARMWLSRRRDLGLVPGGFPLILEPVRLGIILESSEEGERLVPRPAGLEHLPGRPFVGGEILLLEVAARDHHGVEQQDGAELELLLDLGVLEAGDRVHLVDVRDLVGKDESQGVILVLGDPVEEASADVDIAAGGGEGVQAGAVEHGEGVLHVLAGDGLEVRSWPPISIRCWPGPFSNSGWSWRTILRFNARPAPRFARRRSSA